jgi:hypothetical protein
VIIITADDFSQHVEATGTEDKVNNFIEGRDFLGNL